MVEARLSSMQEREGSSTLEFSFEKFTCGGEEEDRFLIRMFRLGLYIKQNEKLAFRYPKPQSVAFKGKSDFI